ncbi:(4Fe-4S)-binding protein [Chitinophaga qingshengii]|uniref:(4Fe-4S)-binding protein n=1 Tax=Chitinophaga qingshengii TaxID=1569794 RepID=A0ABR7TSI5_9BACT|nr:(4Fe-4S)-binding protein [Chitinophaga qingshengii]MBC9933440.1 (4Fe-4S)-binding protein [Chitinophaga qingshengii]
MKEITKKYSNGEVTIVWKPEVCKHSEICFHGLPEVFDPKAKPWINAEGSTTERIIEVVKRCPSGALTYYLDKDASDAAEISASSLDETVPNGPRLIYGNIVTKNAAGEETRQHRVTAMCRCGSSANMPYCDGTHITNGYKDNQ